MRMKNVTPAEHSVRIVHQNVYYHVAAMAQKAGPSKSILEMSLITRLIEFEHGATDDHRELQAINHHYEERNPAQFGSNSE